MNVSKGKARLLNIYRGHLLAKQGRKLGNICEILKFKLNKFKLPSGWSSESADFINQCIKRKKFERLGYRDISEVK